MPGRHIELAVVPAGALRLAGLADLRRRIAVDHRDELAVGLQVGDPTAADRHEPEIPLVVEGAAFEKPGLVRTADIGEFLDRTDTLRQWWQTPGLHRPGVGGSRGGLLRRRL